MPGVAVKITKFLGEAPRVSDELLPETSAQVAYNTKLYSGDLVPYRRVAAEATLAKAGTIKTIYPMENGNAFRWLHWTDDVNIATGQIENDASQRIYYSGDTSDEDTAKVTNFTMASTYTAKVAVSRARTSNVATVITEKHYLRTGEYVNITLFGDATFNVSNVEVTVTNSTTFTYVNTGADVGTTADTAGRVALVSLVYPLSFYTLGLPTPLAACTAAATSFSQLSSAATNSRSRDSGNTATVNLSAAHNLVTGVYVTVTGFADTSFNLTNVQITVTDTDSFTYFSYGPAVALGNDAAGRVDLAGTTYPRTYVYTWYTLWGEESTPSPASNTIFAKEGQIVELTALPSAWPGGYTGTYQTTGLLLRIYRTIATAAGTEYFLLGTNTLGDTTFSDNYDYAVLVDTLESEDYDPPPAALRGMMAIHNGMMAGFFGNTVCFSMPEQPHAWPIVHYTQVDSDIVAIGLIGKTIVVATEGRPWAIQGNTPENMNAQKDDSVLPCSSKQSLVNLPYGVVWASPGGLAVYAPSSGGARLTEAVHSWDTWDDFIDDTTIVASFYQGKYFGSASTGSFIFERNQQTGGTLVESDTVFTAAYYRIPTDAFYYAIADASGTNQVYRWDSPLQPFAAMDWKSKVLVTKDFCNLGAARVIADYTSGLDAAEITTYNDAILAYNLDLIAAGIGTVSRERTTDVATIVTALPHQLLTGDIVTSTGFGDATFNVSGVVITVTNSTTFTYPNVGSNVGTTADTAGAFTLTSSTTPRFWAGMGSMGTLMMDEYAVDSSGLKSFLETTQVVGFTLYANKQLVFTRAVSSDDAFRMPTGYRTDTYEVEVAGAVRVRAIHMAETMTGLKKI